jgi:nucleotide-binding universal stress UspA family protein
MDSQPHTRPQDTQHRIVVGVDGSPSAREALKWAVRQAELTGACVDMVIAWHYPVMAGGYGWVPPSAMEDSDFAGIAEKVLAAEVAEAVDPASAVRLTTAVRQGNAAEVLLDAADGADLLVLGSRGHGGFAGALLGSVSQHCAHHAPCPIVIIRAPRRAHVRPAGQ